MLRAATPYTAAVTISPGQATSALPRRAPATHSRAGNGMARTREAALSGAVRAVAAHGARKATMGDIAGYAGIAKATLYNHFRTREDVYRAAVEFEVERIADAALKRLDDGLAAALAEAAKLIAEHPALRRIARDEPSVLAMLATIGDGPAWVLARERIAAALDAAVSNVAGTAVDPVPADPTAPPAAVDLVLRVLVSQLVAPAGQDQRVAVADLLALLAGPAAGNVCEGRDATAASARANP
jgi:AcrR family transcriptional regulator